MSSGPIPGDSLPAWSSGEPGRPPDGGAVRSFNELGLHGGCGVDANQPGAAGSEVGEAVRHAGRADDDVARPALDGFVADLYQNVAVQDDEGLVVGMMVQLGSLAGLIVHEEERHRRWAVRAALEG